MHAGHVGAAEHLYRSPNILRDLDRARLVVVPVGLEAVVRSLAGNGICASNPALELAEQILSSLWANLRQAGNAASLDVCVDGPSWTAFSPAAGFALSPEEGLRLRSQY